MNSLSNFQFQSGETMGVHVGNSVDDVYVAGEDNGADNHDNDGYSDDSDKSSSSEVAHQSSKSRRSKTGGRSGRLDSDLVNHGGGSMDSADFRGAMDPDGANNQHDQALDSGGSGNQRFSVDVTPIQRLGLNLSSNVNRTVDLSQRSNRGSASNVDNNAASSHEHLNRGPFYQICKRFLQKMPGIFIKDAKFRSSVYQFPEVNLNHKLRLNPDPRNILAYEAWRKETKIYLNQKSRALEIWENNGVWGWEIKMDATMMSSFMHDKGFNPSREYTQKEMVQIHSMLCKQYLELSPQNYNLWNSSIFVYNFLIKAVESVPILDHKFKHIKLNDTVTAIATINHYYQKLPVLDSYKFAVRMYSMQPEPKWSLRTWESVILFAKDDVETLGQTVQDDLCKYLYFQGQQLIHPKEYYAFLNQKVQDPTITYEDMKLAYEKIVLQERKVTMEDVYKGNSWPDNSFAIEMYNKMHVKHSSQVGHNASYCQEVNVAIASPQDRCRRPQCRKNRRYASHSFANC